MTVSPTATPAPPSASRLQAVRVVIVRTMLPPPKLALPQTTAQPADAQSAASGVSRPTRWAPGMSTESKLWRETSPIAGRRSPAATVAAAVKHVHVHGCCMLVLTAVSGNSRPFIFSLEIAGYPGTGVRIAQMVLFIKNAVCKDSLQLDFYRD